MKDGGEKRRREKRRRNGMDERGSVRGKNRWIYLLSYIATRPLEGKRKGFPSPKTMYPCMYMYSKKGCESM